jgi:hypothetical protein
MSMPGDLLPRPLIEIARELREKRNPPKWKMASRPSDTETTGSA